MYLLDYYLWEVYLQHLKIIDFFPPTIQQLVAHPENSVSLCQEIVEKLEAGAKDDLDRHLVKMIADRFQTLPFNNEAHRLFEEITTSLSENNRKVAAIAMAHHAILVTNNGEFNEVVGLRCENW